MYKIGIGQDSHKLRKGRSLVLGGVKISDKYYLEADSDGDVILHAIFNALSSAIGEKPLGFYATPLFKQGVTDSKIFLEVILEKLKQQKCKIENVAITVEAKIPRFEKILEPIRQSLAKILEIKANQVGISPTSGDGLTAFGRGEGIQVMAVVLISK